MWHSCWINWPTFPHMSNVNHTLISGSLARFLGHVYSCWTFSLDIAAPLSGFAECQLHLLYGVIPMDRIRPRFHNLPLFFLSIMSLLFLNLVDWVRRYQLWHLDWVLAWYQHRDWNNQFCPSRGQFLLRLQHPIKKEANACSVLLIPGS